MPKGKFFADFMILKMMEARLCEFLPDSAGGELVGFKWNEVNTLQIVQVSSYKDKRGNSSSSASGQWSKPGSGSAVRRTEYTPEQKAGHEAAHKKKLQDETDAKRKELLDVAEAAKKEREL